MKVEDAVGNNNEGDYENVIKDGKISIHDDDDDDNGIWCPPRRNIDETLSHNKSI